MRQQYMLAQKLPLSIWSYRTAIQADKGFNKYRFLPKQDWDGADGIFSNATKNIFIYSETFYFKCNFVVDKKFQ